MQDLQVDKRVSLAVVDFMQKYSYNEGGFYTLWEYANLYEEEQNKIYNFLSNSYVFLSQQIGNKKIALVHAVPPKLKMDDESMKLNLKINLKQMRKKYKETTILQFLQNRNDEEQYEQWKNAGFSTICGHTPLLSEIENQSHDDNDEPSR